MEQSIKVLVRVFACSHKCELSDSDEKDEIDLTRLHFTNAAMITDEIDAYSCDERTNGCIGF